MASSFHACHQLGCSKKTHTNNTYIVGHHYFCGLKHAQTFVVESSNLPNLPNDGTLTLIKINESKLAADHKRCYNHECLIVYPADKKFDVYDKNFCSLECLLPYKMAEDTKSTSTHQLRADSFVRPSCSDG